MKSLIIVLAVILTSQAYAQKKTTPKASTEARVQAEFKAEDYIKSAKDKTLTKAQRDAAVRYLEEIATSISGLSAKQLEVVTAIHPEILNLVKEFADLALSTKPEVRERAVVNLRLLSVAGKYTKATKEEINILVKATQQKESYNSKDYKDFMEDLINTLEVGVDLMNPANDLTFGRAVEIASKGRFTLEDFLNCIKSV